MSRCGWMDGWVGEWVDEMSGWMRGVWMTEGVLKDE